MNEKQRIEGLLKEYGFTAKKSFGQNFLINEGIIKRIVDNMAPQNYPTVIEIGPGLGSLTLPLEKKAKKLIAVDADRDMIQVLTDLFKDSKNITLIQSDFLRFNPKKYGKAEDREFIGNLPYNITSELLEYLLETGFKTAGLMVQKEVADKLTYIKNKKVNSALGAFIAAEGELSVVTMVDKTCFSPIPKVDSAFIRIDCKKRIPYSLYPVYKALFKDPNKNIGNCLKQFPMYKDVLLDFQSKNDPRLLLRSRQLDKDEILSLAKEIASKTKELNS
ncbi:MAG: 16S rRNA (adenine(1518)-N(6)/adenine(1519)-N(6))-dimethyltransferase RsmA [Bacilli bacterium]